ncbi:Type II pantothenate kinase [Sesbania bispinosa]|nr:Type II pantothenate kinase [Sesbania bispinosa]
MALLIEKNQQVLGIDEEGQNKETKGGNNKRTRLEERDMAPASGNSIHRSSSRPQLDVSKAEIQGNVEEKYPSILLPNQSDELIHMALDIGGSLIKLVYFSRHEDKSTDKRKRIVKERLGISNGNRTSYPILGGRLHFVMFETGKINECLDFIHSKQLHCGGLESRFSDAVGDQNGIIKATGGGAYKYADLFKERLGVSLDKEDEMDCLVAGANFLLKSIRHEAFIHMKGQKEFVQIDPNDLFPYLLVNIGSGVSMIKVDGDGKFERVSGTNVGGGTFWGLGRLLTKCKSFDELLELSQKGDNRSTDMLVGDIYGGLDHSKIAYLNALRFRLKRIFFGGFFIRGHAYTMDTISFAVQFWSKGEAQAMFLQHEGFLGVLGAFMSYEKHDLNVHQLVESFPTGAPYTGDHSHDSQLEDLNEKVNN